MVDDFKSEGVIDLADFDSYLEYLSAGLGHKFRAQGLKDYCWALLLPLRRKSVESLAASLDPFRVQAKHQSLHHFVAKSEWSDDAILRQVREWVMPALPINSQCYWVVDDVGHAKYGKHSIGVARQDCTPSEVPINCQIAVSLSLASALGSVPIAYRLFLPKEWAEDAARRKKAGVPETVTFATKSEIALAQLREAKASRIAPGIVLADTVYGDDMVFRKEVTGLSLYYSVGIRMETEVRPLVVDSTPLHQMVDQGVMAAKTMAMNMATSDYQEIFWRQGSETILSSRFARVRVQPAHRNDSKYATRHEEWLLIEWPAGKAEPSRYFLSTLPADISLEQLVQVSTMRWRTELDYQELKQECGLSHYEGRGWRGFHHHATLCIAVFGYLVRHRLLSFGSHAPLTRPEAPVLPIDYRPRGSGNGARSYARLLKDHSLALSDGGDHDC